MTASEFFGYDYYVMGIGGGPAGFDPEMVSLWTRVFHEAQRAPYQASGSIALQLDRSRYSAETIYVDLEEIERIAPSLARRVEEFFGKEAIAEMVARRGPTNLTS